MRVMRFRHAVAVAATTVVSAGAAALAAGRYGSRFALNPGVAGPPPGGAVTVHSVTPHEVVLTRTTESGRPGVYGLSGPGVHATVGRVLRTDGRSVTRELLGTGKGTVDAGAFVRLTPQAYAGDPRTACGLEFHDVEVEGELGPMPAWYVPGARSIWVIAVHGVGATREQALAVLPALHRFRLPVLVPTYRNDAGAPASPDRIGHLGATEWRDLDAAMRHAVAHGATALVLYGWSTGAAMALRALRRSPSADKVAGLVLDSPVLDWRATVTAAVRARGLPAAVTPLAVRAAQGRTGAQGPRSAEETAETEAGGPAGLDVPTLIVHGPDDTFAPWSASRALAARYPGKASLHTVPGAAHTAMWNADPAAYEETLRRFLTPLM